jgi:hypothetical protein
VAGSPDPATTPPAGLKFVQSNSSPVIRASLRLFGHAFDPARLAIEFQLPSLRTWQQGESIQQTFVQYKNSGIELVRAEHVTWEVEQSVIAVLDQIEPYTDRILRVMSLHALAAELSCYVNTSRAMPAIHFSTSTMARLVALKAEIDIDIILCAAESDVLPSAEP